MLSGPKHVQNEFTFKFCPWLYRIGSEGPLLLIIINNYYCYYYYCYLLHWLISRPIWKCRQYNCRQYVCTYRGRALFIQNLTQIFLFFRKYSFLSTLSSQILDSCLRRKVAQWIMAQLSLVYSYMWWGKHITFFRKIFSKFHLNFSSCSFTGWQ